MIRFRFREITSPDREDGYLKRWEIETPWFGVKLHRFLRSDAAPLHDHPWPFLSLILWGRYVEYLATTPTGTAYPGMIRRGWLSVAYRRATDRHRVELVNDRPVWTLCLTGPRQRDWYFYPLASPATDLYSTLPPDYGLSPVRVPWRVMVDLGERLIQRGIERGVREPDYEDLDRILREREARSWS